MERQSVVGMRVQAEQDALLADMAGPPKWGEFQRGSDEIIAAMYALGKADFQAALRYAREARKANHPASREVLALVLYEGRDYPAALEAVNDAMKSGNCSFRLLGPASQLHMAIGDFRLGAYLMAKGCRLMRPSWRTPPWSGEPLCGRKILIMEGSALGAVGGLGYGDEVMWARFSRELASCGADVYLRCSKPMLPLLSTLEGVTVTDEAVQADCMADPLELPYLLGIRARAEIPSVPYLSSPKPTPAVGESFSVGISWGCGPYAGSQTRYCALSELSELGNIAGVTLYSLEKGQHAAQLYPPPTGMRVIDLGQSFKDFADTAAAIDAMDLIVTTDNVVANIAGALGKTVYVLADFYIDPRFVGPNGTTPWYSTARVFKQETPGAWPPAVAQVAAEVRRLMAKPILIAA